MYIRSDNIQIRIPVPFIRSGLFCFLFYYFVCLYICARNHTPMLRVLIIDDEPIIRKDMEMLLKKHEDLVVVGACGSLKEARVLLETTSPDLLLLDIQLTDGTGFELLQELEQIPFQVIFITAYNQFAIKAIKYGALDYLLKPIDELELDEALEKVRNSQQHVSNNIKEGWNVARNHLNQVNKGMQDRIVLRSQQYLQVVPFEEIVYCQNDGGYTHFFLTSKKKIVVSKSIKEYNDLLPDDEFLRPHQSYLVNARFIDKFHKDGYLILRTGEEIPVSTRKKDHVIAFLTGNRS